LLNHVAADPEEQLAASRPALLLHLARTVLLSSSFLK
jgi:hypothetical protein